MFWSALDSAEPSTLDQLLELIAGLIGYIVVHIVDVMSWF